MIRVLIHGICGQMGHAVYAAVQDSSDAFAVAAGVDRAMDPAFDCRVYPALADVREPFDVIIDFSVPDALPEELAFAQARGTPIVVGTTALPDRMMRLLESAAEHIPVFQSGNMSLGVNLQMALVRQASAALGSRFDVEIIEKHHRRKIDAPSGTALMLASSIASERPGGLEYVYGRHEKNHRRTDSELGFHSVRGGTIVGEHEVSFIGQDEVVEISHRAFSKRVFAEGALRAAQYLMGKPAGLYHMENIMTEQDVASHVSELDGQAVITATCSEDPEGFAAMILARVAERNVSVDMISCTVSGAHTAAVGFSLPEAALSDALNALKPLYPEHPSLDIHTRNNLTKLTVEGSGMAFRHGVAAKLLTVLRRADVPIALITTSETKIELCVEGKNAMAGISVIEREFLGKY